MNKNVNSDYTVLWLNGEILFILKGFDKNEIFLKI